MPSPRIAEPSIPKDGRSIVQDNTASDVFAALAPTVAQIGVNYIGNEMQNKAIQEIGANLQATKDALLQQTSAPRPPEADAAVSDYARRVSNVNSAVDQGKIGANAAKTRIDALTREYSRRFPAFASEFTDRNSQLEDTITTAFQQDATIAAASQRAEEDAATRKLIADHGFNPDDPQAVQLWMNLKQQAFIDAALESKYKRDKAAQEQAAEMSAHRVQLSVTSNILEQMTSWLKGYDDIVRTGGPAAAEQYFTQRSIAMAAMGAKWEAQIIQEVPPGPQQDRLISQVRGLMENIGKAGSPQQLSGIASGIREVIESRAKTGFMVNLNPGTREIYAAFGPNLGNAIQNINDFIRNQDNYERSFGKAAYQQMLGDMGDMLGIQITSRTELPPDAPARIQGVTAEVVEGRAPPNKEGAAAGSFLMNGGANLNPVQTERAYNALVDGGRTLPLSWFTRTDRINKAVILQNNPRMQRQVAREVAMIRQYTSQNPDARMVLREEPNGEVTWNIVDKGRVLLSSKQPVSEQGMAISQAWPDAIRDTLNAGSVLGSQGVVFNDLDRLFSDLNPAVNPVQPPSSTRPASRSAGNR